MCSSCIVLCSIVDKRQQQKGTERPRPAHGIPILMTYDLPSVYYNEQMAEASVRRQPRTKHTVPCMYTLLLVYVHYITVTLYTTLRYTPSLCAMERVESTFPTFDGLLGRGELKFLHMLVAHSQYV